MRGKFVAVNQLTIVIGILAAQLVNWLIAEARSGRGHGRRHPRLLERADRLALDVRRRGRARLALLPADVPRPRKPALAGQERARRGGRQGPGPGRRGGLRRATPWPTSGRRWPPARSAGSASAISSSPAWPRSSSSASSWPSTSSGAASTSSSITPRRSSRAAGYGVSDVLFNIVITGTVNLVFTLIAIRLVDRLGPQAADAGRVGRAGRRLRTDRGELRRPQPGPPYPDPRRRRHRPLRPVPRPGDLGPPLRDLPQPHPRRGHVRLDLRPVVGLLRPDLHLPPAQQGARPGRDVLDLRGDQRRRIPLHQVPRPRDQGQDPGSRSSGSSSAARTRAMAA